MPKPDAPRLHARNRVLPDQDRLYECLAVVPHDRSHETTGQQQELLVAELPAKKHASAQLGEQQVSSLIQPKMIELGPLDPARKPVMGDDKARSDHGSVRSPLPVRSGQGEGVRWVMSRSRRCATTGLWGFLRTRRT